MDRKQGTYTVNAEPSRSQLVCTCPNAQGACSSTGWCPPPNNVTGDVSSNLPGVWMSPSIHTHAGCPHPEPPNPQGNASCYRDWSLCKVFLACLLACVVTTAIGVLFLSLVNNKATNSSIIIQLLPNGQTTMIAPGVTSAPAQPAPTESPTTAAESTPTTATATAVTSAHPQTTASTTIASTELPSTPTPTSATSTATTATTIASTPSQTTAATTATVATSTTSTASTTSATTPIATTSSTATTITSTQPQTTTAMTTTSSPSTNTTNQTTPSA